MLKCTGGPGRVHRVLPSLACQQARSLLEGSGGLDSPAAGATGIGDVLQGHTAE